ncbi:MAG: hypothetical protein P4K98_02280 [Bryobacteraceae bacterium]|nr:hypothetical protein [Bryobacteraceae bacterium]
MLFAKGLAVSLPAREFVDAMPQGALLEAEAVLGQRLSGGLRAAVQLLCDHVESAGRRLIFILRPEIFTHGEPLAWLNARLGEIEDHLSLSDGVVVHLLPGRRNHLFFYRSSQAEAVAALKRLDARAPELAPQLVSQVNSCFSFGEGKAKYMPRPVLLQATAQAFAGMASFREFYFNDCSIEDSVARSELAGDLPADVLTRYGEITYIPVTGVAAADPGFNLYLAQRIRAVLCTPERLLLLGAPLAAGKEDTVPRMLTRLLHGLLAHGGVLPRAVLGNVIIATALLDPADLPKAKLELVVPEGFEFWRLPRAYYSRFARISVAVPRHRTVPPELQAMLTTACGIRPALERLDPPSRTTRAGEDDDE